MTYHSIASQFTSRAAFNNRSLAPEGGQAFTSALRLYLLTYQTATTIVNGDFFSFNFLPPKDTLFFQGSLKLVLATPSNDNVIHLQHHSAKLSCEEELLAFSNQRVDDEEVSHVIAVSHHTVHA